MHFSLLTALSSEQMIMCCRPVGVYEVWEHYRKSTDFQRLRENPLKIGYFWWLLTIFGGI
jgi:hypothetical protein